MKDRCFFEIPIRQGLIKTSTLRAMVEILEENKDVYAKVFLNDDLMIIATTIDKEDYAKTKCRG